MPPFSKEKIESALVMRLSSLGDVLLTTPMLRILKRENPSVKIDFVVKAQFADAVKYNPVLNKVFTLEKDYSFSGGAGLELNQYGLIIDLQNNFRTRKLLRGANVPVVRFRKFSAAKFISVKFKFKGFLPEASVPERYISTVPGLEEDGEGCEFYFHGESQPVHFAESKVIGLCPGSKHFTKQWPLEYFIQLAQKLNITGYSVAVIGGADDRELGEELKRRLPGAEIVCGENDLFRIGEAMLKCRAVVCNDSGLMHLATALRIPAAVVFGSTIREFGFAPYNAKSIILENNFLSCRPCSHIGRAHCPKKHFKCMKEILPEQVFQKLVEFAEL